MNNGVGRMLVAWLVVLLLLTLLILSGCASVSGEVLPDAWGRALEADRTCDFGILRGTKSMRCAEEFNRKEWFLWT